jgi:hypothetical protein
MKLINTDSQFDYFIDHFRGIEVRMKKDKLTQQIYFSSDSVAKILGFSDANEMIQSNTDVTNLFLDGMNKGLIIKDF